MRQPLYMPLQQQSTALVKYMNFGQSVPAHAQEQSNAALKRDRLTNETKGDRDDDESDILWNHSIDGPRQGKRGIQQ